MAYDALFAYLFHDWPGPEGALRTWSMSKFAARKQWALTAAEQLQLPIPTVPRFRGGA